MPALVAIITIIGTGATIIGSVIAVTYKLTRAVTEVETTVRFLLANYETHVSQETRNGELFRADTTARLDAMRVDINRLEIVVATKMRGGRDARSA